jgi:hypothetical protein
MHDIRMLLELWGAWAANDNSKVDWQPIAAGFKGLLPSTNRSRPQCNDDEGLLIDSCVTRLKMVNGYECELIILYYVFNLSLRRIARLKHLSDGTIRKQIQTAEGFILGCLCMIKLI